MLLLIALFLFIWVTGRWDSWYYRKDLARAHQALRDLQTATAIGVTYPEYSKRLIDTKIAVERSSLSKIPAGTGAYNLAIAMMFYEFAGEVWQAKVQGDKVEYVVMRDLVVNKVTDPGSLSKAFCPALKETIEVVPVGPSPERIAEAQRWRSNRPTIDEASYDKLIDAMAHEARYNKLIDSIGVIWGCASQHIAQYDRGK